MELNGVFSQQALSDHWMVFLGMAPSDSVDGEIDWGVFCSRFAPAFPQDFGGVLVRGLQFVAIAS